MNAIAIFEKLIFFFQADLPGVEPVAQPTGAVNIVQIFQNLLADFASVIPNVLGALVVGVVGWILSRMLSSFVMIALKKMQIDKLAEKINDLEMVQKFNMTIDLSRVIAKIIYYFMMLIFMVAATEVLGMKAVSDLISDLIAYIPLIISATIVLLVGMFVADLVKGALLNSLESLNISSAKIIANFVFYFIMLNVLMSALQQAKVNTGFIMNNLSIILAGGVLAFSLAYGFASRGVVSNLLSSYYMKGRFQIGMEITIEGHRGEIIDMDGAVITLQTESGKVLIPLGKLINGTVEIHH
jgi:small-conductance mechanosensitive channel